MPHRPALIWLTQAVLVCVVGVLILAGWGAMFSRSGPGGTGVVAGLAFVLALAGPLVLLFYGLARRRRWAWVGSFVFAALVLILVVLPLSPRPTTPSRANESAPARGYGAMLVRIALVALIGVYAGRLYLSPDVRAFLRVPQRAGHDT